MPESVFAKHTRKYWPHVYAGTIAVYHLVAHTPTDPKVIAGWLQSRMGMDRGDQLVKAVGETMAELGLGPDEAAEKVAERAHLNAFKRDEHGLYIEGRHLKACIKEAASVARAAGNLDKKWGETNKGAKAFVAEHIMVIENRLHLTRDGDPVNMADDVQQRFVQTYHGSSIQYEEYCQDVEFNFTIETDYRFPDTAWQAIWLTAEREGIGACRSQGYGRFVVTRWEYLGKRTDEESA